MNKKCLISMLVVIMFFNLTNAMAVTSGNCGTRSGSGTNEDPYVWADNCQWTLDGTNLIISGEGIMGDFEQQNGKTTAPWGSEVTSVTISNGITSIGNSAFAKCENLTTLNLPNSLKSIGKSVFSYTGLTDISLPDSVLSIGNGAFYGASSLENINFSSALTNIGRLAFDTTGLKNIVIPDGVTSIGWAAFANNEDLISVVIEGNPELDEKVFEGIGRTVGTENYNPVNIYCLSRDVCESRGQRENANVVTYTKDKSGLFALTDENGDILEDVNGNPIYYLSANDMTTQSNACLGGYQTCAKQALHNKALALLEKGTVCQMLDTCQALVNTDYNGDVIKLGGKDYASLSDLLKGNSMPKRIYTIDEANLVAKPTGNTIRIKYR